MTATSHPQDSDINAVDMIRALTLGCPGVAAMSPVTRTYLPGRTVAGVTTDQHQVTVRVIAQYGTPLPGITERLGNLLYAIRAGRALQVYIDDIVLPGQPVPGEEPATGANTEPPVVAAPQGVSPLAGSPRGPVPAGMPPIVVGAGG